MRLQIVIGGDVVGLVVDDQHRAFLFVDQQVDDAGQERPIGQRAGEGDGERRLAAHAHRGGSPRAQRPVEEGRGERELLGKIDALEVDPSLLGGDDHLLLRGRRGTHVETRVFEHRVRDRAAAERERPAGACGTLDRRQIEHPPQVPAVAAAVVFAQRGVAERRGRRRRRPRRGLLDDRWRNRRGGRSDGRRRGEPQRARERLADGHCHRHAADGTAPAAGRGVAEEARSHPGERGPAQPGSAPALPAVEGAAEDQELLSAGHRHVHDPPLLLDLALLMARGELVVGEPDVGLPAVGAAELQADAAVAYEHRTGAALPGPPDVREHDDRELKSLGAVDGHDAHNVIFPSIERRVRRAACGPTLDGDVIDERAQVTA
ncbi:unannotated protein [freshwater metagenome]|uniref:Unannotated protein n=1 Tax=freshwater metagenome TaxID=449393 RepID=A0A6J7ENQ0_9ZZZZ